MIYYLNFLIFSLRFIYYVIYVGFHTTETTNFSVRRFKIDSKFVENFLVAQSIYSVLLLTVQYIKNAPTVITRNKTGLAALTTWNKLENLLYFILLLYLLYLLLHRVTSQRFLPASIQLNYYSICDQQNHLKKPLGKPCKQTYKYFNIFLIPEL